MRNLKNSKAAGTDEIHPELIKYGGNKLVNRIMEKTPTHALFTQHYISLACWFH